MKENSSCSFSLKFFFSQETCLNPFDQFYQKKKTHLTKLFDSTTAQLPRQSFINNKIVSWTVLWLKDSRLFTENIKLTWDLTYHPENK